MARLKKGTLEGYRGKRIKSLLTDDMEHCYFCGKPKECIHEVYQGEANRRKSMEWGCFIPLCFHHHSDQCEAGIHNVANIEMDLELRRECQMAFEKKYSHEKFMKTFHRNYLEVDKL